MAHQRSGPAREVFSERSFWALILTQFQGAFSDNAFKTLVTFLVVGEQLAARGKGLVLLVGALFAIPFLVFSMTGGYLADRYSKRRVTIATKWMEIGVMLLALAGLWTANLPVQLAAVLLMSVQSALFSPSKYGLLPELLSESRLSWGNGILNLATFLAIISGIVAGGVLAEQFSGIQHWSGFALVLLALCGLLTARWIAPVPAADPGRRFEANPVRELAGQLRLIWKNRILYTAVAGGGYFFFLAAFLQFNILFYGLEVLQLGQTSNSILMAAIAIGIGLGSFLAGVLSGGKIEYGLILLGSLGMTGSSMLLALPGLGYAGVAVLLAVLGMFGGFFTVPVNALVQHLPDRHEKGRVLAASNIVSFVGVALASGAYYVLVLLDFEPAEIFLVSALMGVVATLGICRLLPDSLWRLLLWAMALFAYRVSVKGRENIPEKGAAVLVAGRLTLLEALLLVSSTDRTLRFLADGCLFESRLAKMVLGWMHAVPASPDDGSLESAVDTLRRAFQQGDIICLTGEVAEGASLVTWPRLGAVVERITEGTAAPVLSVSVSDPGREWLRLDQTVLRWEFPSRILVPVTVSVADGAGLVSREAFLVSSFRS